MNTEEQIAEEFRDIKGYEGLYQVSNIGNVKSLKFLKKRLLRPGNMIGYLGVVLYKNKTPKTFLVHRLVGLAFIDNPQSKPEINHINGLKDDNRLENLEWSTGSENMHHAFSTGLKKVTKNYHLFTNHPSKGKFGKDNHLSKAVHQYSLDGVLIGKWDSITNVKRELGLLQGGISKCCRGEQKTAGGYIWKFNT